MKKFFRILGAFCLIWSCAAAQQQESVLKIADASGGSALLPLRQAFLAVSAMKEFSGIEFEITRTTPKNAMTLLEKREAELIIMEMRDIPDNFPAIRHPFAAEALICYTGYGNPLRSISIRQLKEIWAAETPQWKKYNGEFNEIKRVGLTAHTGGFSEARFMGGKLRNDGVTRCKEINRAWLFCTPSTLLCAPFTAQYPAHVIMLSVENTAPTKQNIVSGAYPLNLRYHILYRGKLSAAAKKLLSLLDSTEYSGLFTESGLIKMP